MVKYEPNFFVPCDNLRNASLSPVLCKDEPLQASQLAMDVLDRLLSQEQRDAIILDENKAAILPEKLQEKVKIVALRAETLILKTNSSVWRAEIMAIKSNIMAACNRILGKIAIKTIKIQ